MTWDEMTRHLSIQLKMRPLIQTKQFKQLQVNDHLGIGHESEPMTASHLTKEPESSEKTIEASRSANTAQQGEDTSQKTVTAQSRSGWTITLERISECDELRTGEKTDDESRER